MTYVEWVGSVRMFMRDGLQDELMLKRWMYAVKTHIACCLFRPYSSKDIGWNVTYMDFGLISCRVSKLL